MIKRQRPIKGHPRERLGACVMQEIDRRIRQDARRFGVSRSFVVAVSLAAHFGISSQQQMEDDTRRFRVVRGTSGGR